MKTPLPLLLFLFVAVFNIEQLSASVDTTIYFKAFRQPVKDKEDAKFFIKFAKLEDGKIKFKKFTAEDILEEEGWLSARDSVSPQGILTTFYPEGAIKNTEDFSTSPHLRTAYFKNGAVNYKVFDAQYLPEKIISGRYLFCTDISGKVILENGNGHFKKYNDDAGLTEEGPVKDSLETGEWKGYDEAGKLAYKEQYENGKFIKGESYDEQGKKIEYLVQNIMPEPKGGMQEFYKYIGANFRLPKELNNRRFDDKILIGFIVEKDGTTSSFEILRSPHPALSEEAIRLVRKSPKWKPGEQKGKRVRVSYTLPIALKF